MDTSTGAASERQDLQEHLKVVVLGAGGAIGRAVVQRLRADGHEVIAAVRSDTDAHQVAGPVIHFDLMHGPAPQLPAAFADGVDTVINCAGLFQSSEGDSVDVNAQGVERVIEAARLWNARRIVHLSAAGAGGEALSGFSATKREGERRLEASGLDWIILRPTVVIGRHASGSAALFLALAALPWRLELRGTGPVQAVALEDVVEAVARAAHPGVHGQRIIDVAGPERLTTGGVAAELRSSLGFGPFGRTLTIPRWLASAGFVLGDVANGLGWRSPVTRNGELEMVRGATGDSAAWQRLTGRERPIPIRDAMGAATLADRWFARLSLLRPLLVFIFAAFWIATGLIALGPGWQIGINVLRAGGVELLAPLLIIGGALVDLIVGAMILVRRTHTLGLWAALAVSFIYIVSGSVLAPELWIDPLGPMLKIWPIVAFNLALLALAADER